MTDLTEQEEPFFSLSLAVFLPVTLPSDHSDLFEYSLLPVAPPLKTALRRADSVSLHAPYCNAQLMSGYVTFFLFSARAVSQPPSNADPCQVCLSFLEKVFVGTTRQNRYSVPHLDVWSLPSIFLHLQMCFQRIAPGWLLSSSKVPACLCCKSHRFA